MMMFAQPPCVEIAGSRVALLLLAEPWTVIGSVMGVVCRSRSNCNRRWQVLTPSHVLLAEL